MDLCERRLIFFGRGWPNHAMSMAAFGFGNYAIEFGFGNSCPLDLLWVFKRLVLWLENRLSTGQMRELRD
jgi:hypothetical protein